VLVLEVVLMKDCFVEVGVRARVGSKASRVEMSRPGAMMMFRNFF
jgi:hypothetical protein